MGDSFPKSTRQSQRPGHTSAEGGRRVDSVVSQSCGPGVKYSNLPARLRSQGLFNQETLSISEKSSPWRPLSPRVFFKKLKYYKKTKAKGKGLKAQGKFSEGVLP